MIYTAVFTPVGAVRTLVSQVANVEFTPGNFQVLRLDQRPVSLFEVDLGSLRRSAAESLWAFHALHQGGKAFLWSGGPYGRVDNYNLVAQTDGVTNSYLLPNRNIDADSISVRFKSLATGVTSVTTGWGLDPVRGSIGFISAPADGLEIEARYCCLYQLNFEPNGLETFEVARDVFKVGLKLRETTLPAVWVPGIFTFASGIVSPGLNALVNSVAIPQTALGYRAFVTPNWNTNAFVTSRTTSGFVVNFNVAAGSGAQYNWKVRV